MGQALVQLTNFFIYSFISLYTHSFTRRRYLPANEPASRRQEELCEFEFAVASCRDCMDPLTRPFLTSVGPVHVAGEAVCADDQHRLHGSGPDILSSCRHAQDEPCAGCSQVERHCIFGANALLNLMEE